MYVCMYVCMYIYVCIYIYVPMYTLGAWGLVFKVIGSKGKFQGVRMENHTGKWRMKLQLGLYSVHGDWH